MHFEKLPFELTDEILDRAFNSCFLEESADEKAPESTLVTVEAPAPCPSHWAAKLAQHPTSFGAIESLGETKDAASGKYRDEESERQFGAEETHRVLEQLHRQRFEEWRGFPRDRQTRDLKKYFETSLVTPVGVKAELEQWVKVLIPPSVLDRALFAHDFAMALAPLVPKPVIDPPERPTDAAGTMVLSATA